MEHEFNPVLILTENHEEYGVGTIEHARSIAIAYTLHYIRIRFVNVRTKTDEGQESDDHCQQNDAVDALLDQFVRDVLQGARSE